MSGAASSGERVRLHVGDAAVARLTARSARSVPGVVALRADLAQALLGLGRSVLGQQDGPLPADGVSAAVHGRAAEVTVTLACRLGYNCRDLAQEVQRRVTEEVGAYTGLDLLVRVVIVDVVLD
jgi:uncharacterized alkaline shock family protein YloU